MAFTTVPTSGTKLRASTLAALVTEVRPISIRKSADEIYNSDVMHTDSMLAIALAATSTYRIAADLIWQSNAIPDIQFDWTIPVGATGRWTINAVASGATYYGELTWAQIALLDGTGAPVFSRVEGIINTIAAGTLQLRWAQGVINASNTFVRDNSLLTATKQL